MGLRQARAQRQLTGQAEGQEGGHRAAPRMLAGRRRAAGGSRGAGGSAGRGRRGRRAPGILGSQHPRRELRRRSAAHPSRPCLTSRRGSRDSDALGWLPGPEGPRARDESISGLGGTRPGRSQSGGRRQPARAFGRANREAGWAERGRGWPSLQGPRAAAGGSRGLRSGGRRAAGGAALRAVSRRAPGAPAGGRAAALGSLPKPGLCLMVAAESRDFRTLHLATPLFLNHRYCRSSTGRPTSDLHPLFFLRQGL